MSTGAVEFLAMTGCWQPHIKIETHRRHCKFGNPSSHAQHGVVLLCARRRVGDDSSATHVHPTHAYREYGDYIVSLTVTDKKNQTTTLSQLVVVQASNGQRMNQFKDLNLIFDTINSRDAYGYDTAITVDEIEDAIKSDHQYKLDGRKTTRSFKEFLEDDCNYTLVGASVKEQAKKLMLDMDANGDNKVGVLVAHATCHAYVNGN